MPRMFTAKSTDEMKILSPAQGRTPSSHASHDREWLTRVRLHQITCSVLLQFFVGMTDVFLVK